MNPFDPHTVTWTTLGTGCDDSMPLGNGDVGINLWTEANGDVVFLMAKGDAWSENSQLLKLGRVRVTLSPSPFVDTDSFSQSLNTRDGCIEIAGAWNTRLRIWSDIDASVVHLDCESDQPVDVKVAAELWRTSPRRTNMAAGNLETGQGFWELTGNPAGYLTIEPDTVLSTRDHRITWAHRNTHSVYRSIFENQHLESLYDKAADPFINRTFGVTIKGDGLIAENDQRLVSVTPRSTFRISAYALTQQTDSLETWREAMDRQIASIDKRPIETARDATTQWWRAFWDRSHVRVGGDDDAWAITQGYVMQRFMTAASGRGRYPLKFNGSLFTVGREPSAGTPYDADKGQQDADYRRWGSNYWFQNQRLIYWPMIADGDHDLLRPFIDMYADALPMAEARTRLIYGHGGATFPETMFFFGLPNNHDFGWQNPKREMVNYYIRWHFNGGLELIAMLLAAYDQTQDESFLKSRLVPLAASLIQFFDERATRVDGKLHFEPAAALETRQWAITPAPDIAGLKYILPRLLDLPTGIIPSDDRATWARLLTELPPLPQGRTAADGQMPETPADQSVSGNEVLWPAYDFVKCNNRENPELYSIFPFRVFGVGQPDVDLAHSTFAARTHKWNDCWGQDGIHAACLGDAAGAKAQAIAKFTSYGSGRFQWFWFWKNGMDWQPDLDAAGVGQLTVQNMLMQPRPDGTILLFPAWPKEWDVSFKLHAQQNTTIECELVSGQVRKLVVTPVARERDVRPMPLQ